MGARALMFDFNGTLSDDEPLLFAILADLFAEQGRPLSEDVYYERLAGLSDPEIVRIWLGEDHPAVDDVLAERIARYRAQVADGSTISPAAREAVLHAAERVPVAVVSGAHRDEVVPALAAAGLADGVRGRGHDRGRRAREARSGRLPARARAARRRAPTRRRSPSSRTPRPASPPRRRPGCAAWRSRERIRRSGSPWRTSSLRRLTSKPCGARWRASRPAPFRSASRTPPRSARAPPRCPCAPGP